MNKSEIIRENNGLMFYKQIAIYEEPKDSEYKYRAKQYTNHPIGFDPTTASWFYFNSWKQVIKYGNQIERNVIRRLKDGE